jgi:hypothetical protein
VHGRVDLPRGLARSAGRPMVVGGQRVLVCWCVASGCMTSLPGLPRVSGSVRRPVRGPAVGDVVVRE